MRISTGWNFVLFALRRQKCSRQNETAGFSSFGSPLSQIKNAEKLPLKIFRAFFS